MSADNGIYIAKFPIAGDSSNVEFRVKELQNIEDCYTNGCTSLPLEVALATRVIAFSDAKVFENKKEAEMYAIQLYNNVMNGECPIIEYGICDIEFEEPLPKISVKTARDFIDDYFRLIRKFNNYKYL